VAVLRETVRDCLRSKDYEQVLYLARRERRLVRTLVSLLYDGEPLVRWRAVTAVGRLAAAEPEKVRPLIRRFIWWMNNECGGIGWSSAPALAEIGRMAPELLRGAVRVVIHFRAERMILPGVFWACGRLAAAYPLEVREAVPELTGFLADEDAAIRGQAAWALGEIGDGRAREGLTSLLGDRELVLLYDGEELEMRETGKISAEALQKISADDHKQGRGTDLSTGSLGRIGGGGKKGEVGYVS
jgi:HEAT repeat protein